MDGYNRKKCVAKILYMYVLGYEPDFGYAEALRLLSSRKFSEKQMVRIKLEEMAFTRKAKLFTSIRFLGVCHHFEPRLT